MRLVGGLVAEAAGNPLIGSILALWPSVGALVIRRHASIAGHQASTVAASRVTRLIRVEAEVRTIEAFVVSARRDRWLAGLTSARGRRKLLGRLCHGDDWERQYVVATHPTGKRNEQIAGLLSELTRRGATADCQVMSESKLHDGSAMRLPEALEELSDDGCALIICLPGQLAAHLPEAPAPR